MARPKKEVDAPVKTEDAHKRVKARRITKADIAKSGIHHGMVLVNPVTGEQEIHNISNARDLSGLLKWTVVTEFGSTSTKGMADVLSNLKNVATSNDED